MASRIRIMVGGNKPRLSVRMEGDELVVDCARCFADFLRLCKLAADRKRDSATGQPYQMPALADAECEGYHGHAMFPPEAYDIIVAHAEGKPFDIPLSLQAGVTTETPIATSEADIEAIVDRKIAEREAAIVAAVREDVAETLADQGPVPEQSLDEMLTDELGPQQPPMPLPEHDSDGRTHDDPEPIDASKAAVALAEKSGVDLGTVVSAKGDKIDVRDVRRAIRERK